MTLTDYMAIFCLVCLIFAATISAHQRIDNLRALVNFDWDCHNKLRADLEKIISGLEDDITANDAEFENIGEDIFNCRQKISRLEQQISSLQRSIKASRKPPKRGKNGRFAPR